jgi:hypothetical protein
MVKVREGGSVRCLARALVSPGCGEQAHLDSPIAPRICKSAAGGSRAWPAGLSRSRDRLRSEEVVKGGCRERDDGGTRDELLLQTGHVVRLPDMFRTCFAPPSPYFTPFDSVITAILPPQSSRSSTHTISGCSVLLALWKIPNGSTVKTRRLQSIEHLAFTPQKQ